MACIKRFVLIIVSFVLVGSIALASNERTVTIMSWDGPEFKFRCDKMTDFGVFKTCTAHTLILKNHRISLTMRVPPGESANAVVKIKDDCKTVASVASVIDVIVSGKLSSSTASTFLTALTECVEAHELYYKLVKNGATLSILDEESFDTLRGQLGEGAASEVACTVTTSGGARTLDQNGWSEDVVIAVDNGFIYWIAGDNLYRSRYDEPLVAEVVDSGGWKGKATIAVEENTVYWISNGNILYANLTAGEPAKTLNAGGWYQDTKFAVDGGTIFWLDQEGYLYASALEQPLKARQINGQNYSNIDGFAANAGNVFWQLDGDLIQRGACYEEDSSVVDQGGFTGGVSLAVDDGMLFWTVENNLYVAPLEPSN